MSVSVSGSGLELVSGCESELAWGSGLDSLARSVWGLVWGFELG